MLPKPSCKPTPTAKAGPTCGQAGCIWLGLAARLWAFCSHKPLLIAPVLGALFTLGFAPFFMWPLSLLALAAAVALARQVSGIKRAYLFGFLFVFGHHLSGLYWLPRSFILESGSVPIGLSSGLAALLALAAGLALVAAPAFTAVNKLKRRPLLALLAFVVLWLAAELLRGILFPWNLAGYIWADSPALRFHASWGTVYALSAMVVILAALPAVGFKRGFSAFLALFAGVALSAQALYWPHRTPQPFELHTAEGNPVSLRLVQANVNQMHKWDMGLRLNHVERHVSLSLATETQPVANITIWPETAVPFDLTQADNIRQFITSHMVEGDVLVTGALRQEQQPVPNYRNSIYVLNANGAITDLYDKHILVPFGEYVPLRNLLGLVFKPLVYGKADYHSGTGPVALQILPGITATPLICFEAIFPFFSKSHSSGHTFLLNITNDAWFDGTTAPYQHFAMARLRAIETGKPLVRVANTGISAIIDAGGHVVERLPHRTATLLQP